jgi:hypothetical protein
MIFSLLEMIQCQGHGFMPSQAAGEEQSQQCAVTLASYLLLVFGLVLRLVSQLSRRTPSFFTPSTRRIPAARSALSRPGSLVGKAPHRPQA